jgi:hypothetical protein
LCASDQTSVGDDVLALLSAEEREDHGKLTRSGVNDELDALKILLTSAYCEREGWPT